ncbi:MAG: RluA family pseudouridine synthase [Proteobacteria bacterium]|nr:RluA family pseudouridine synthase [Pseudomonadota bacterium]
MSGVLTLQVKSDEAGMRIDRWFKQRFPQLGHGRLQKLLRTGQVRVEGKRVKSGTRLEQGQKIRIPPIDPSPPKFEKVTPVVSKADAKDLKDRVLHQDEDVIVINKPSGLAVQGGSGLSRHLDAMLDALRFGAEDKPRLVHRLDKDTSGVLLLARNASVARILTNAFRTKTVRKLYWAVVVGVPQASEGFVDLALAKLPGQHGERVVPDAPEGKKALTHYRLIDQAGGKAAWLAFEPLTGRTHQLRVHALALGTPILGDGKYGGREAFLDGEDIAGRLHLHARALRFPHPAGGFLEIKAPLPKHMLETFKALGFDERQEQELFIEVNDLG